MSNVVRSKAGFRVKSQFKDMFIPRKTLPTFLLDKFNYYGDLVAAVEPHTGRRLTFSEFVHRVKQAASGFARRGVRKGDIVLVISPNDIDYGVVFIALASLGAIMSTVNPESSAREIRSHIDDSSATYLIIHETLLAKTTEITKNLKAIKAVFAFGKVDGMSSLSEMFAEDIDTEVFDNVTLHPDDVIFLPYSSGTTGKPKGVMHTHRSIIAHLLMLSHPEVTAEREPGLPGNEIDVLCVPLFHVYGLILTFLITLYTGGTIIVMQKFNFESYLRIVRHYKPTVLHIVPPIVVLLTKDPVADSDDLSNVHTIVCGGAPLGKTETEKLLEKFGRRNFRQVYGMTECLLTHISPKVACKHGSVGALYPNVEAKIVSMENDKGPNQQGEVWLKGPATMKGYHKRPDATAELIDQDGWIHTGDIGYYDEDGHFFFVDRTKELIKYKAFQVAPAELESLLLTHPAVADVAVIGVPDEVAGEHPLAFIVKKEGIQVTADDIINFVNEFVDPHKRLRGGVRFAEAIPKSPSGKILRRLLRDALKPQKGRTAKSSL